MPTAPLMSAGRTSTSRREKASAWRATLAAPRTTPEAPWDSYVITEDDYIEYLAQPELQSFLPVSLHERLKNSHILFMGYALRDWNLRVVLRRIWDTRRLTWTSWAVQLKPDNPAQEDLDRRFWLKHDVEIVHSSVDRYIAGLREQIGLLAGRADQKAR